jgi:hypothetical protein
MNGYSVDATGASVPTRQRFDSKGNSYCDTAMSTLGVVISLSSPTTYTYGGPSGALDTISVVNIFDGVTYKKTLTYTGSNVTSVSGWVKQ